MPNYDYTCTSCGYKKEEFQKITEAPLEKCPSCSKTTLQRGFGGGSATFCFKGKGFYLTDYKNQNSSSPAPSCGCGSTHTCH